MSSFNKDQVTFIVRSKENRKHVELKSLITNETSTDLGNLILLKDSLVYLYTGKPINNKRGNIHYREELVEETFRLIVAQSKDDESKLLWNTGHIIHDPDCSYVIYKHANNIGYKTAKRRFTTEIRNLIISIIVVECVVNPYIFFNKLE
jgi:hypothetical protein